MLRRSNFVVLSLLLSILTGAIVLVFVSEGVPHSIANTGDHGLSKVAGDHKIAWISDLKNLIYVRPEDSFVVIARTRTITLEETTILFSFISSGGIVLAYGGRDFLEALTAHLNMSITFYGNILDTVFNAGSRYHINVSSQLCGANTNLTLYAPYGTRGLPAVWRVVAVSSSMSFHDLNENGYYDIGEPISSFPVAVEMSIGRGRLLIVFSEYLLENFIYELNRGFLECISSNRAILIDQSEVKRNPLDYSKLILQGPRGRIYAVILVLVLILVSYYVLSSKT